MKDKANPNGFYRVADKRFEIKVGQKDHQALAQLNTQQKLGMMFTKAISQTWYG